MEKLVLAIAIAARQHAVVLGVDGVSDFNALHSRKHDDNVRLYASGLLAGDGDDCRKCHCRCARRTWLGSRPRRPEGIFVAPQQ
jgi:bifunctional non-homologous end joining protein LigD